MHTQLMGAPGQGLQFQQRAWQLGMVLHTTPKGLAGLSVWADDA
jgi:hypothetical protein